MNYTLHQLEIFVKVAETLNFSRAAEQMFLTQPAISIQLKKFQEQFDRPLIEVIKKRVSVTKLGHEVLPIAIEILENQRRIQETVKRSKWLLSGELRISSVSTGKYVIPYFLRSFLDKHPGVSLDIHVDNRKNVLEELAKNKLDFALVSVLPGDLEVESIPLLQNQLNLVGCADANYNENHNLETILSHFPPIYREDGSATKSAMEKFLKSYPKLKSMKLTSNEAVKQAVIAGLGSSVMPIIGLKHELNSGEIKIIPREGLPIFTTWNLIWLKEKKLSHAATAYIQYLLENKEIIKERHFNWTKNHQ